jgi:phage shock protein E
MKKIVPLFTLWTQALLLLLSAAAFAESTQTTDGVEHKNAATPIWLDVRSFDEYKSGHIDGALNIAHTQIEKNILTAIPDKDQPVYLYCRSGHRSGIALKKMKALGYTNLVNVGGLNDARKVVNKSSDE